MAVRKPTLAELARIARRHQLQIADDELAEYQQIIEGMLPSYEIVERLPEPLPAVTYARTPGYRPRREPAQRLVLALLDPRRAGGQAQRQAPGDQRQRVRRGFADGCGHFHS